MFNNLNILPNLSIVKLKIEEYNYSWKLGVGKNGLSDSSLHLCFLRGGVFFMEDMISKIVDMDKKARDITAEAQKSKIDYEHQIIQAKEKIKNDYLERAVERIKINQQTAQKKADEALKVIQSKNAAIIDNLEKTYSEKSDSWVDEIVSRVVGE